MKTPPRFAIARLTLLGVALVFVLAAGAASAQEDISSARSGTPTGPATISVIGLDDAITDRLLEHLSRSKRFVPVEREALRKVVLEQRFGAAASDDYVSKTLDKSIGSMESVSGFTVAMVGVLASFKDTDNDLKDLGTAVGADYLVVAQLEKFENRKSSSKAVPYSTEGRTSTKRVSDGRLRFRVVEVDTGSVIGAGNLRSKLSENVYEGGSTDSDDLTFVDHLSQEAAAAIIDVTFPAKVVSISPLVISRGANDGVAVGDRYRVQREGDEVKDGDIVLGRLLSEVGELELSSVNERMSSATSLGGGSFAMGDLAVRQPRDTSGSTPAVSEAPVRPGSGQQGKVPRVALGTIEFGATGDASAVSVSDFTDTIISGLAATKRFQMIDRQEVDQLLREQEAQALTRGEDMASPMGTLKGADYLVYGNVALYEIESETQRLPNSSKSFSRKVGRVDGNVRVVDARSGEILESRGIAVEETIDSGASRDRAATELAKAYSADVVQILLNAIYPIKVAAIGADGTVYVNRGRDGGLERGATLEAYRPGPPVVDPDTGIELGVQEVLIGGVELASIEDARSTGRATTGSDLRGGDILRRSRSEPARAARKSGSKGKRTLAMGRIRVSSDGRVQGSQRSYVDDLTDDLAVRLSRTNRFDLLEREEVDQLLDEKDFQVVTSGGDMREHLQSLSGADYLVYGEVTDFRIETDREKIELLDEVQERTKGIARLTLHLVDVASGSKLSTDNVRIEQRLHGDSDQGAQLVDLLAASSVERILERIYPIRVIGLMSDQSTVYLNRGQDGGMKTGEVFELMRPGSEMVDPDTGVSFGAAEEKVATLRVTSVEASRSRATLLSGETPAVGDIARPPPPKAATSKKKIRKVNKPSF